ncbi:MAG TPA: hypothetical protein VMA54_00370 [Steroidobacteraceae bacterium]|nr:hypothetical protein [Steroidobacteraceae bacterium]
MITRRRSLHLLGAAALGMASARRLLAGTNGRMPDGCASVTVPCLGEPYVDIDEWRGQPVRHRYIHGGFKGTQARFSLYFPPKAQYQGRFFQYITPVPIREDLAHQGFGAHNGIGFAIESGAYAVATNEGGTDATATPGARVDPSIAGYRVNAAAAQYSRVIAARIYGPHRPYGYAYGGSGGSYRTIAGFENTTAWDGAVPYVMPCPMAIPSVFTPRLFAMRVLKDRFGQIVDAIDPGGSGDMYAGLNEEERETLREATAMGFPPRTWFAHQTLGMGAFAVLFDHVVRMDPQYFVDFWTVPGYLGANPPKSLLGARIRHKTVVTRVIMSNEAAAMGLPGPATAGRPSASAATAWENLQRRAGRAIPAGLELEEPPRGDPAAQRSSCAAARLQAGPSCSRAWSAMWR